MSEQILVTEEAFRIAERLYRQAHEPISEEWRLGRIAEEIQRIIGREEKHD